MALAISWDFSSRCFPPFLSHPMGGSFMGRINRPSAYGNDLDYPGYAQEFLRRNPDYRQQYADVETSIARGGSARLREVMALEWGLSFPLSSRTNRFGCTGVMVTRRFALYCRSRTSTARLCARRHTRSRRLASCHRRPAAFGRSPHRHR